MCRSGLRLLLPEVMAATAAAAAASTVRQALCTSDTAAACYCGCLEQLEPETIELLAAMTEAAVNVTLLLRLDCSAPSAVSALLCALSSEIIHGLNCQELPRTT